MKLATFNAGGAADELGIVKGDGIVPISRTAPRIAADMADLIARWSAVESDVRGIAENNAHALLLHDVRLKAPIARPGKIMAIGLNYADHVKETGRELPTEQIWFCKQPTATNGPFDQIQIPKVSTAVDWEAEMVVVIGRGGRHIAKENSADAVFGYCCGNDVSARDWQNKTPQWILGKSFDTHAPFGPWITTADEVGDPHTLDIKCIVNGETRQSSNTSNLVFNVWDQLAHLSQVMTLEPGDLIFTGTPGGVGVAMKPPVFLKDGDMVRIEIEKLGAIEARCADEK